MTRTIGALAALQKFRPQASGLGPFAIWLAIVIGAGYAAASIVSAILMTVMMKSAMPALARKSTATSQAVTLSFGRQPNYRDIRRTIMERNMFNADGTFPEESAVGPRDGEAGRAVFDLKAPCQKSTLNIQLVGTIYMGTSESSFATVREQGYSEADIYRVGDTIFGNDETIVVAIERKKLVLNNKGVKECLELAPDTVAKPNDGFPAIAGVPATDSGSSGAAVPVDTAGCGGTVQLEGPYVESELGAGFAKIINAARMVPNTVDNQVNGFKIFSINQASILGRIGFQNGDVITQVNDTSLKLPEQGFALFQALQDERDLRINLLRGGSTPCNISVRIK